MATLTAQGNTGASAPPAALFGHWASDLGGRFSRLDPTSVVVFSVVCVMVLVLIIAVIVWRVRRSDLQSTVLIKDPVQMFGSGGLPVTIASSLIPPTLSGQEYSYSFWLYLVQYNTSATSMLVFGRGVSGTPHTGGSPLVYLDKATNTMYVSIANVSKPNVQLDAVSTNASYVTGKVDYVPLQRWVHFAFVVQDYLMTVYMDGDVYTVSNVTDLPDQGSAAANAIITAANAASSSAGSATNPYTAAATKVIQDQGNLTGLQGSLSAAQVASQAAIAANAASSTATSLALVTSTGITVGTAQTNVNTALQTLQNDKTALAAVTVASSTRAVFSATSGDITVGDTSAQPQAFLSQLVFFNYALTQQNVYQIYASGPLSPSAMSLIGIPAYGIRAPIYKLS